MNFMKYNVLIVLVAIIIASSSAADEAKSSNKQQQQQIQQSQNNVPLSSSVNDAKQQNKRLAYFAPSSTSSSGFKPITSSYPTASSFYSTNHYNHVHYPQHQQAHPSGLSSSYAKHPYGNHQHQQFLSPSNVKFSSQPSPAYNRGASLSYGYNSNQQLAFAASQPAAVSYVHSPYQLAQQIFAQQLPLHNYNVHQLSPIIHAPTMGIFGSYQGPVQSQFPHHFGKFPQQVSSFHQPQTYASMPSHQSQQKQQSSSSVITSKPTALESPHPTTSSGSSSDSSSSSEVHHNQHGAVSYSTFLQPADRLHSHHHIPTASALIATQPPQPHLYYHHNHQHQAQPQTFVDYTKHFSGAYSLPIAANYYGGFNSHGSHIAPAIPVSGPASIHQPYAHLSKFSVMPTPSVPTPQVVSVSVVPTIPQKITLH